MLGSLSEWDAWISSSLDAFPGDCGANTMWGNLGNDVGGLWENSWGIVGKF